MNTWYESQDTHSAANGGFKEFQNWQSSGALDLSKILTHFEVIMSQKQEAE
jgi:hypothetical protein